ncbi:MAG TPA: CHAT domain-containing protein [Aromatoleum sp.]|uniref:CHAT domain-containing protein n=1 Tax=Aromatoleum sp. TaxID=2307007 RepID=UPI002B45F226|nr:CHAT domain-containing protein [Aromatoleum sp.]HJV25245.1 CHAT domain-containing protein [Aromatoleum sp.]
MAASRKSNNIQFHLPGAARETPTLPPALKAGSRGAAPLADPFLDGVVHVEAAYTLSALGRDAGPTASPRVARANLVALEATDGSTVFIRADKLRDDLARVRPEAVRDDGSIDLAALRDPGATARGLTDWLWSGLSVLSLTPDEITDAAREKALEWLQEWLGEPAEDLADASASWLGAKALMWAIENQLAGEPGIYHWRDGGALSAGDRCAPGDTRLGAAAEGPMLLFIHGTGSHTLGSFKELRTPAARGDWEALARRFGDRVFGFEHRTFSESPIENALQLARTLPAGARLSVVTHSRGGLVGDLLCLAGLGDDAIAAYRHLPPPNEKESARQKRLRDLVTAHDQASLKALRDELAAKNFQIERYVRVASPARGTRLLSDNLDVFLSGLLSLMGKLVGAVTGPAGGAVLSAFKRIVLEIADKRIDARIVPGIEAMLTDAPMSTLLAGAQRKQGIAMGVIAGDIEGGNVLQRLGVMFTDWMLFDRFDNDLVVDTDSMYAGLATRNDARYVFDQGASVNHFSYFTNRHTRAALRDWLTADDPATVPTFAAIVRRHEPAAAEARRSAASRGVPAADTRPVVIFLPGIMGSNLEIRKAADKPGDGDRVWFDFLDLASGGLPKIRIDKRDVHEESLFDMFYGELAEFLEATHRVIRFPYDWRQPIQGKGDAAERLAATLEEALDEHPNQPVRLLAHSMGGLVCRTMIARRPDLWEALTKRSGGRFVMLGTPNNGSYLMVETLLGKSSTMRQLARLDLVHGMQTVLDIVAGFPGALQLLPRPKFVDGAPSLHDDYLVADLWPKLAAANRDRWFGDGIAGHASADALALARELWDGPLTSNDAPNPVERVHYVFGQSEKTPCGLTDEGGQLKMLGTPEGDGSVSWASGRLGNLPPEQSWYMPVDHGALANTEDYFPAILDLLQAGATTRLGRLPASRGTAAAPFPYDAAPPVLPTEEELARSVVGSRPRRRKPVTAIRPLQVCVTAMDLRFARQPLLCGHYLGDAISGAEGTIDRYLVGGALRQRERLGVYAGDIGSSAFVLQARSNEDRLRGTGRGAVIVGLGRFGALTAADIAETVRAGVLRFLLVAHDRQGAKRDEPAADTDLADSELTLASLLIGFNSTTHISVDDSIEMIVRGVLAANRQFAEAMPLTHLRIARLEFIELYLDTALSAARAVSALPQRMASELRRLEARIDAADMLYEGEGARPRLSVSARSDYWPRLLVTAADQPENLPVAVTQPPAPLTETVTGEPVAEFLKYVFLSERARAESLVQQRQPGLIEALVGNAITHDQYDADLARTLFQLMVPLDFKASAREADQLVLVVDGYTANLPWEMLQADDLPMVVRTAMVRQFATARYRRNPLSVTRKVACVIANPSTRGFFTKFGKAPEPVPPEPDNHLPDLPGAAAEGAAVRDLLGECGYQVNYGEGLEALEIFARLFRQPCKVLAIAGHGVFHTEARDGKARTGVVLSDGMLLTAAEVSQMEIVPELVFLNCCHLGAMSVAPEAANRLAYSLARELIEIGVRCVVAAGWQVNDDAATLFARSFFEAFVRQSQPFGKAIFTARLATWEQYPLCNTWGAYQAYGDPQYMLDPPTDDMKESVPTGFISPIELVDMLGALRTDLGYDRRSVAAVERQLAAVFGHVPPAWQNLPEVQAAVGSIYAELGSEGFEHACVAYARALAAQDLAGRVPVRIIEQLANLEARRGEAIGDIKLIDSAIGRLQALIALATSHTCTGESAPVRNMERYAVLGSALKRKAAVVALTGSWADVRPILEEARNAYASAECPSDQPDFDPYPMINRLQLDWLLLEADDPARHDQVARQADACARVARRLFAQSGDFFNAVKPADAELTARLFDGLDSEDGPHLASLYDDAIAQIPRSRRKYDSVVRQIVLLARFTRLRAQAGDAHRAEILDDLAGALADS